MKKDKIVILDFGAQYSQLIARRVREAGVYAEIYPYTASMESLGHPEVKALILSGGPSSVLTSDAPMITKEVLFLGKPVLGICYGMQIMTYLLSGKVVRSDHREYGHSMIRFEGGSLLTQGVSSNLKVWMSHGDVVKEVPEGFSVLARSENGLLASMADEKRKFYGVQFHPEVTHTDQGFKFLENFVFHVCGMQKNWDIRTFIKNKGDEIRAHAEGRVITSAVSGGVDSTVMAVFLSKVMGKNLHCIFVNNGVLRKNESRDVQSSLKSLGIDLDYVDASRSFLRKLKGVKNPEKKRRIIGHEFIDVFFKTAGKIDLLAQGTLYPDVIESVSVKGPSATIKTHHNRVKGILKLIKQGRVVEPFSELFKDEVRKIGLELGMPEHIIWRQPFPGPGLAVRILGDVSESKVAMLQEADAIVRHELNDKYIKNEIWQAFAVLLPVQSVGVMGDERTYENVIAVRAVSSLDGMTADWYPIDPVVLRKISSRIINEVKGVNRVVYDISSKPPSTIEWE